MRRFTLKVVPILTNETLQAEGMELNYRSQLLEVISKFPNGISIEKMRGYLRVHAKLRRAKDGSLLFLEEAEHQILLERLREHNRFAFLADEIVQFYDDLAAAEEVPEELPMAAKQ